MLVFIVRSVIGRITSILNAIKTVREGEYNYHVNMSGNDELALLGDEFNSLTSRLRETEEIRRRFVANASHELKTPLASIRLLTDSILQNEGIERVTMQEFISDIGAEAERLSRTTEKLMTLTRIDSRIPDDKTSVDIGLAVVSTLRMLNPLAVSRGLSLESNLMEDCFVLASEDTIHQIIFNLVENAIKYNKPNGCVEVSLYTENDEVILNIDDTGVGVPDEDLSQIFDRFYRVDKARSREAGGSGLGLAIVRDSVRELEGKVSAETKLTGGMRFQVRFKRAVDNG
jgi:signal transduction histidine kinase